MAEADLFGGLVARDEGAFPRRCGNCGRVFETPEQFLAETRATHAGISGLKSTQDDDGSPLVEAFRNCPCGSTLLENFNSRRSEARLARRQYFDRLMRGLMAEGVPLDTARQNVREALRAGHWADGSPLPPGPAAPD